MDLVPDCTADEVGMVVGDTEDVDDCDFIGRANFCDFDELVMMRDQQVTNLQFPRWHKLILPRHKERMLRRRFAYSSRQLVLKATLLAKDCNHKG